MTIHKIDVFENILIDSLTPNIINFLAESALICLDNQGHKTGVSLKIEGDLKGYIVLSWTTKITETMKDAWNDFQDTTEDGATYLAILIIHLFTSFKVIKRSQKGTGFDYWLGDKNDKNYPFQEKARLEISGILQENKSNTLNQRVQVKLKQTAQSDNLKLPAYIIVVEFSSPKSKVAKK